MRFLRAVLHLTFLLLFFFRGLAFTCKALQNMQSDTTSELHVCFKRSYDEVLRHHHSFIIRSVISVSLLFPDMKSIFVHCWLICSYCDNSLLTCFVSFYCLISSSWVTSLVLCRSFMPDYSINHGSIAHLTLSSMTNCLLAYLAD